MARSNHPSPSYDWRFTYSCARVSGRSIYLHVVLNAHEHSRDIGALP
jgi:hypothetical protein